MYPAVQNHRSAPGFAPSLLSQTPRTPPTAGQAERAVARAAGLSGHGQPAADTADTAWLAELSSPGRLQPCCLPPLPGLPSKLAVLYLPAPAPSAAPRRPPSPVQEAGAKGSSHQADVPISLEGPCKLGTWGGSMVSLCAGCCSGSSSNPPAEGLARSGRRKAP